MNTRLTLRRRWPGSMLGLPRASGLLAAVVLAGSQAVAGGAGAGSVAITVTERIELGVTPARAWGAVENFMAWPAWHTGFDSTQPIKGNGHSPGSVRLLMAHDGTRVTDELLRFDAPAHSLQFRTLRSALPFTECVSTLLVLPHRGGSIVVLSTTFRTQPQANQRDLQAAVSQLQRQGLDNLATAFE